MYQFQDHAKGVQQLISLTKMKESFHSNGVLDGEFLEHFLELLELLDHAHSSINTCHCKIINK